MIKIRLKSQEREAIVRCIKAHDSGCTIYLYGSRMDPQAKGGDIDLLVESEILSFSDKLIILSQIKEEIGDQKIDLTIGSAKTLKEDVFFAQVKKFLLG